MSRYLWAAALAVYLLLCVFFGERLPYNDGLGFDGYFYGTLAQNVPDVLGRGVPDYYLDRILPSLIVWLSAKALGTSLTTAGQTVAAFHIYNSLLLTGAAVLWVRLSYRLELSIEVAIIGAAALFVNWTVLKQYQYFVVQTDATALAAGVLASVCVIERRYVLLAFVAVLASFAFKAIMPLIAPLILFSMPAPEQGRSSWLKAWCPAVATALALATLLYAIFWQHFQPGAGAAPVSFPALPLSILITAGYVYYTAQSVDITRILAPGRLRGLKTIGAFILLWGIRTVTLVAMARVYGNDIEIMDIRTFFIAEVTLSVAKPAVFLIAHVVAFGPAFIIFLWYLERVANAAALHSVGAVLFLAAALALSLNPETRQMTFAYPLVVTFLCVSLQGLGISRTFAIAFVGCSVLLSRCYLPLNALGMTAVGPGPLTNIGDLLQFPWQWVFMSIGPWMGWIGYATNLAMIGLVAIVLYVFRPLAAIGDSSHPLAPNFHPWRSFLVNRR